MHPALLTRVLRERWRGLTGWAGGLVLLVAVQVSVYPTVRDSREDWSDVTDQFPEAFRKIFRMEDYTSPSGYLSTELFSFMVPLIFVGLACTWAARAGAEEEENGTADILLSLPVSRWSVLLTRLAGVAVTLLGMSAVTMAALLAGTRAVDMGVGTTGLTAAVWSCAVLALTFGGVSVAAAAWTGRRGARPRDCDVRDVFARAARGLLRRDPARQPVPVDHRPVAAHGRDGPCDHRDGSGDRSPALRRRGRGFLPARHPRVSPCRSFPLRGGGAGQSPSR